MGKRKKSSRKPMGPKKREGLATTFQCLFCNHENSVTVKVDKKSGIGQLSCKVCGQNFQTTINYLSAPIDVYSDWIDACEAVQKQSGGDDTAGNPVESTFRDTDIPSRGLHQASGSKKQGELDDFIEDDEGDMEGGYLDE